MGSRASSTTVDKKIGLMYVSDYYYSASSSAWTLVGNDDDATKDYRAAKTTNWLSLGSDEWTISRYSNNAFSAFTVVSTGKVYQSSVDRSSYAVRPTFSLLPSVTYASGEGTLNSPIRIN